MVPKKQRVMEILLYYMVNGSNKTSKQYGIKEDTIRRYINFARNSYGIDITERSADIQRIANTFTASELSAIAKGGRIVPGQKRVPVVEFNGVRIRLGILSDTHIGSKYTHDEHIHQCFDEFDKADVDIVLHAGDVTEGMSKRDGHVYELSHIGYDAQKKKAIELLGMWDKTPSYVIDGNHDRWYLKNADVGANIVKNVCDELPNWNYLGHDTGIVSLGGRATVQLWHGGDGSSYALSYRLQKIVESLPGGEKPSILIAGHVHKYVNIFERNIYCLSPGSLQRQTDWMRGRRIGAHVGFCIADVCVNKSGVSKFTNTWYPFYT